MQKKPKETSQDVALLCDKTEDGEGAQVLRFREGKVQAAEVRPVKQGQTLNNQEMIRLHPRTDLPFLFNVEVVHTPKERDEQQETFSGPVRVSSKAYRDNWDRIFSPCSASHTKKQDKDWLN